MSHKTFKKITRHGWLFSLVKKIVSIFKKKPTIFNKNDTIQEQAIFISNHSAASGPMILALYFPVLFVPWGAHPMMEGYGSRWQYLYHIFYKQKLGYNKCSSFILATLFALVSKMLYKGMGLIPTYGDARLRSTISMSQQVLDRGNAVLVFPEDSNEGYQDVLLKYHSGFAYLALDYYSKTGINLPIYPIYFHKKKNAMIIDRPMFIEFFKKQEMGHKEIAEFFREKTNALGQELDRFLKEKTHS